VSRLDFTQAEQLKEIGAYLSQVRLQQAISLEEVATRTFIPLRLLKALEAGQADPLPEPVFIQGFIRRYADLLGLDGSALSKAFPASPMPMSEPAEPKEESMRASRDDRPPIEIPFLKIGGAVLAAAALGGVVYLASSLQWGQPQVADQDSANPPEEVSTGSSPSAPVVQSSERPTPIASAEPQPSASPSVLQNASSPSPTPIAAPTNAPIQVAMEITSPSWVEVTIDGKSEFVGKLEKGAQKTWTAKQKLVVFTGNAGGVKVSFNQGTPEVMGKAGALAEKTFSAENPAEASPATPGNAN
jgi:cytoskeletal protein RodZ